MGRRRDGETSMKVAFCQSEDVLSFGRIPAYADKRRRILSGGVDDFPHPARALRGCLRRAEHAVSFQLDGYEMHGDSETPFEPFHKHQQRVGIFGSRKGD